MIKLTFSFLLLLSLVGCQSPNQSKPKKSISDSSEILYAERFSIKQELGATLITIDKPWQGSTSPIQYVLYKDSLAKKFRSNSDLIPVKIPINTMVSNSTTHLAFLEELGAESTLIGFAQTQYIYSEKMLMRKNVGQLKEVGVDGKLDVETIVDLAPDIVMAFNASAENRQLNKLASLGVIVVMNADYMETSALGRYEWIKFMGYFLDKRDLANELFNQMVVRYDSLKSLVANVDQPSVMVGSVYGGSWFLPGGNNNGAKIIADAGGNYLWKEDKGTGWLNIDYEVVYATAWQSEYWIGVANYSSLTELAAADERYTGFAPFMSGNIYTYTARVNAAGANDYFESGNVSPDRILADYIKMLHPDILPDYELYYYQQLE